LPDAADEKTKNATSKEKKGFTIGYVGGFYPGRGIEMIIELSKQLPSLNFVLIGANEKMIDYYSRHINEGQNNLKILGYLSQPELEDHYADFDVVLAPYSNRISVYGGKGDISKWTSPLKIFEYMSFAKPIIVANIPVLHEVLTDCYNCIFANVEDTEDWIKKILLLKNEPSLRKKIANNAYNDFIEKYTWQKRAEKIIDLFRLNQQN
jgi:glycosyltransferase involved in cell wall biosynthesis